jgi:hypothetical protein
MYLTEVYDQDEVKSVLDRNNVIDESLYNEAVKAHKQEMFNVYVKKQLIKENQEKIDMDSKVLEGDIFILPGIPVITTNLGGVHGAGLAQLAKTKGLIKQGDGGFKANEEVVQLPVKKIWSDNMLMNNNMELLKESLRSLIKVARENKDKTYLLPLAGLGHGEGSVEEILPLLIKTIQSENNIKLVLPAENINLGRQGTTRKDYTRENMPKIKAMLLEAGLLNNIVKTNSEKSISELGISQEEWNNLSIEEQNKIKECN